MTQVKIIHIDYASKGNSGTYIAQILRSYRGNEPVDAYVHSQFKEKIDGIQIYKLFDHISKYMPKGYISNLLKFLDLYICFGLIVVKINFFGSKNKQYVFVQFHQSFHAYKWLFKNIYKKCNLIVTIHDAVELKHNYPSFIMSDRDQIIRFADTLIVHGIESIEKLRYYSKPILMYPFPLMISDKNDIQIQEKNADKIRFLFIGHIRLEKGIEILVNAWKFLNPALIEKCELTIAGTNSTSQKIDFSGMLNTTLKIEYIDDNEFVRLISMCHYVVMPYWGGTNSGILSVAAGLGKPCITSRIPLFYNSDFFEEELSFDLESDLSQKLTEIIYKHDMKYEYYLKNNFERCRKLELKFKSIVNDVYNEIINK